MIKHSIPSKLANWAIHHPIAISMMALTCLVVGIFSFAYLKTDLLPELIYPEIRVRILQPGVPTQIMEDQITRQLEEQLAITEGVTALQSSTSPGRSAINLSFPYGTDIDAALRDASTRLDRAKRFLPNNIEPPTIYKRDPSQIPVLEFIVSAKDLNLVQLQNWVDYEFSKWFITIPGVASTEVGGGLIREIRIRLNTNKLAQLNLDYVDIKNSLNSENINAPGGVFHTRDKQFNTQINGRFTSIDEILNFPIKTVTKDNGQINIIKLEQIADVIDTHADEKLRIRLNGQQGIKLSIQKQPQANTVEVVDNVLKKLNWFKQQNLLPANIQVEKVGDQSSYVRHALRNAAIAVLSGALLAMLVVYIFLGDIRRTLIVSSAIPLAILITLSIMNISGLSLNIMSLGGLALGVGILVDNTIVMLENISRHQQKNTNTKDAAEQAASEISSAITASTSTNLVAVVPFLFIGGLVSLLFNEFIITLSAAILASLIVALTLVPALGASLKNTSIEHQSSRLVFLQQQYQYLLSYLLRKPRYILSFFIILLFVSLLWISQSKSSFFPKMDEGRVTISIRGIPGSPLQQLDESILKIEEILNKDSDVQSSFTTAGGFVFGRSEYQFSHRGSIIVQLKPLSQRNISSQDWVKKTRKKIKSLKLINHNVRMRIQGVRGVRLSKGDDDISIRIQGDDTETLSALGDQLINKLKHIKGLNNLEHNQEDQMEDINININHIHASILGISTNEVAAAINATLNGEIISDFIEGDKQYNIRLLLKNHPRLNTDDLKQTIIATKNNKVIRLIDVATISVQTSPRYIKRDNQRRILEISASLGKDYAMSDVIQDVYKQLNQFNLPNGYNIYDGGSLENLRKSEQQSLQLLALAIFLVFAVMAIQYESLKNPLIIILGALFTAIGIAIGLEFSLHNVLTMPAKIGIIMLVGIVVNNSIVLVEQIEIQKQKGDDLFNAILNAATLRFRPILMTTITTVMGMLPLAIGLGDGAEMLKPMATIIVFGLSFSMLVSLILIPILYRFFYRHQHYV